jgi:transposase
MLAEKELVDVYFADEAGFSLTPYVPYGWQKIGEQVGIPTKKKQVANVLGLLNPLNKHLITYTAKDKEMINTEFMIKRLDDLAEKIDKETMIVLDNAPWHKSKKFFGKLSQWQQQGLYIFHLPAYSPHMNLIETLWRKIKYEWLRPKDYNSKTALKKRLKEIFTGFADQSGKEPFDVNFSFDQFDLYTN